ncbi:MAG: Shikimate kinase [Bacilli bacterium]|nr:Shikimate kinase [Bacilli bacterium]
MNLYLLGFMATGKTTVGKELSAILQLPWVDLDHYLEQREGRTIPELFRDFGEEHFRNLEQQCLEDASKCSGQVVTTGGGVILRERNREMLKTTGFCITLTATPECIWNRVSTDSGRPLLQHDNPQERIKQLMEERSSYYAIADCTIDTTGLSVDDIVGNILTILSDRNLFGAVVKTK